MWAAYRRQRIGGRAWWGQVGGFRRNIYQTGCSVCPELPRPRTRGEVPARRKRMARTRQAFPEWMAPMCKATRGRRLPGILQPQATMRLHSRTLAPLLLSLAAASTLVVHSRAEASRLATTVIVGRVTSQGRPVAGAAISLAGRAGRAVSARDGRYAISVARASESERVTLLARYAAYEPWQN